jgi:hypothetical protein
VRQFFEFLRTRGNWLVRFFRWILVEPKKFWITLLPVFIGVIIIWFIPAGIFNYSSICDTLETRFRLTGLFLELSGIFSVVYGLNKTLKLHLGKNLPHIVLEWFKRFPKLLENQHGIELSAHMTAQDNSSAVVTFGPIQNSAIEDRVTRLEEQFNQVSFQAHKDRILFENEFKKLSDSLNAERNERESGDNQVKQDINESAVEDAYIELIGIIWLFIGAIFASASTELAMYFS